MRSQIHHLSPLIGPGPSAGPGRAFSGVFLLLVDAAECEWAPIISARLGGIHTRRLPTSILANSITSRPTILSPALSYCTTHTNNLHQTASRLDRVRAAHNSPSLGDAPLRAGWLHACIHDPHPALRLNKFAADGCPTPSSHTTVYTLSDRRTRVIGTHLAA